jgi:hypothetical protein
LGFAGSKESLLLPPFARLSLSARRALAFEAWAHDPLAVKLREVRVSDHSSVWPSADRAVYGADQLPPVRPIECVNDFNRSLEVHEKDSFIAAY